MGTNGLSDSAAERWDAPTPTHAVKPLHIRIFLSSPGDVSDERNLARKLIKEQLPYDHFIRGRATFEVLSWDDPVAQVAIHANESPQHSVDEGLPRPSQCDVVIAIFWSRMGTPLPDAYRKPDSGERYLSGTEWEYEDALRAKPQPTILVYRRLDRPPFFGTEPDFSERVEQLVAVQKFFDNFRNPNGSAKSGFKTYQSPSEFSELLGNDLKAYLRQRLAELGDTNTIATTAFEELSWKGAPYPGLRSFERDEAPIFFGRDEQIDKLVDRLRDPECRFLAVVGASGTGKSSLVRAGLLPRLAGNAIGSSENWRFVTFKPASYGENPFLALAAGLQPFLPPVSSREPFDLAKELAQKPTRIREIGCQALMEAGKDAELVLFVDQLEDIFKPSEQAYRENFIDLLVAAATSPCLRILATLREDLLSTVAPDGKLAALVQKGSFILLPPGPAALANMIQRPAERAGLDLERGLVDEMLKDAGRHPGSLPLVAFCLEELYRESAPENRMTLIAYERAGRLQGAIGRRAKQLLDKLESDLGPEIRNKLPIVFGKLVNVDTEGMPTRKLTSRDALTDSEAVERLVDALTNGRLLSAGKTGDQKTIELAHDALFRAWPELREWIDKKRDVIRLVANAMQRLSRSPLRSAQLALEALDIGPSDEARETLQRAVQALRASRWKRTLKHADVVNAVEFSPSGEFLASASSDKSVKIWKAESGKMLACFDCEHEVFGVAFSPDRQHIAVATGTGQLELRNIENRARIWSYDGGEQTVPRDGDVGQGHRVRINSVLFSSNGECLITASDDATAVLWNAKNGEILGALHGHEDKINWAVFSPDGKRIATASWDRTVRVWDARSRQMLFILRGHTYVVNCVDFSPYGGRLASASWDGTVKIWDSESGKELYTFSSGSGGFTRVAFGRTGKRIATGGQDWRTRIWEITSGRELLTLSGHTGVINGIAFSPDASHVASAGWDHSVKLWNVDPRGHRDTITCVAFRPEDKQVATASQDGTAKLWDIETGEEMRSYPCGQGSVLAVAFTADGIVTASSDRHSIRWIDWLGPTGEEPEEYSCVSGLVRAAAFSPGGRSLMTIGYDSILRIWEKSGDAVEICSEASIPHEFDELAFTSNRQQFAIAGADRVVRIVDLSRLWNGDREGNGEKEASIDFEHELQTGHTGLLKGLTFSEDGRRLATASLDGTVKVWALDSDEGIFSREIYTFVYKGIEDAACPVDEVALSPDGTQLAATGFDGTLKVWDIETKQGLFGYSDQTVRLSGVAFSPNGKSLVATVKTGAVQFYDLSVEDLKESARKLVRRMEDPEGP